MSVCENLVSLQNCCTFAPFFYCDTMTHDEPHWVVIYTKARAERKVVEALQDAGFEAFLPLRRERRKWSDRYKVVEVPVLPSYVFVRIPVKMVAKLYGTRGLAYVVKFGNEVAVVPERQIEALRIMMQKEMPVKIQHTSLLRRHANVMVTGGELMGYTGTVVKDCSDGNFSINIEVLNYSFICTLDQSLLKVID